MIVGRNPPRQSVLFISSRRRHTRWNGDWSSDVCSSDLAIEARTNWLHFYAQDSWQIAANLRLEIGVRYEYNQNMTDSGNQMAAIDTSVPGGRFVVASDGTGRISQAAKALLASLPVPFVPSSEAGWDNSLLAS